MAKPLASQVFEDNLIMLPEASSEASEVAPEASDNALSKSVQNNPAVLAARYGVSDRTIQNWVKRLVDECNIPDSTLRIQHGIEVEYSAHCIKLLDQLIQYRQAHGSKKIGQWFSLQSQTEISQSPFPSAPQEKSPTNSPSPVVAGGPLAVVGAGTMDVHTVPSSKIEVLQGFVESKKPQPLTPIDLNGTAEAGADRAIALMEHLQQRRERTDAVIGQLYEREQSVSTTEQALDALEAELAEQKALEQAAIQKAYELRERETDAQERLGKLEARSQQ